MSNLIVTSPQRPYTFPDKFKAVSNGDVYAGLVDKTDLENPANQIQVYVVGEDGSETPVSQPLKINSGGLLVYNGQPAKFIVKTNYSMLVKQRGKQVSYEPNMAFVDPESALVEAALIANLGDSKISGGQIWPISSKETASAGDEGLASVKFLGNAQKGINYRLSGVASGDIDSVDFDAMTATIGGVDYTMSPVSLDIKNVYVKDYISVIQDHATAIKHAASFANKNNLNVSCEGCGTLTLTGSERIEVKCNFDIGGATLNVEGWGGGFDILRKEEKKTYSSTSDVVQNLISAGTMTGNFWDGWKDQSEVIDSFVVIKTTQPFYSNNGILVPRVEFNKSVRNGIVESKLKYPLDPNTITEIDVYPMEKEKLNFGGGSIYLGSRDLDSNIIYRSTSLHKIHDIRFILDDVVLSNSNPITIFDEWFCQVRIEDVYFQWGIETTSGSGFSYQMQYQNGYNWKAVRAQGMGDGWGVTGGNIVQRAEFQDCDISRVDFHHPYREYLKVSNSRIGDFGILVTGIGDLILNDNEYLRRNGTPPGKSSGFIRLRSESNGFVDGDLIINNEKYNMNSEANQYLIRSFPSASVADTTGSPINFTCFNSIIANGLSNNYAGTLNLAPVIESSSKGVKTPTTIVYRDCLSGNFEYATNMTSYNPSGPLSVDSESPLVREPNLRLTLENVKIPSVKKISITDRKANNFCIRLSLKDVRGSLTYTPVSIQTSFFGRVYSENSDIESIDFQSGGVIDKKIDFTVNGGVIKHQKRVSNFVINGFTKGKSVVNISNCAVSFDAFSDLNSNVISQANLSNNSYTSQATSVTEYSLKLQTPSGGNVGILSGISFNNRFVAKYADNSLYEFTLPQVGSSVSIVKTKSIETTVSASTTAISLAGDEAPVNLYIK